MRKLLKTWAGAAALWLGLTGAAMAAGWSPMPKTMPTQTPGKIEVVEFFWYGCPHCYHLEPSLEDWAAKLPKDVAFRRVHAAWNNGMQVHAQLFAAISTLEKADPKLSRLHRAAFDAIHKDGLELRDTGVLTDWIVKQGVDKKKFMDAYQSFSAQTYARQSPQLTRDYGINGVPTFIVNGKYMTSPSMASGGLSEDNPQFYTRFFQTLNQLIDQERKK